MYRTYQAAMDSLEPFKAAARFTAGMMRQAWPHQSWPQAAIMGLGALLADWPALRELDINPLIVGQIGCTIVDARALLLEHP